MKRIFPNIFAVLGVFSGCASTEETAWDQAKIDLHVSSVMNEHRQEFMACYERELTRRDQLKLSPRIPRGGFKVAFAIGQTGEVLETEIVPASSTLKNAEIERCVLGAVKKIEFGKMGDYTRYNVTYPFEFEQKSR